MLFAFSFLELGSKCLCKYQDGIWYEGVIVEVEQENHRYTVHFESYDQTEEVGIEDILPLGKSRCRRTGDQISYL